MDALALLCHLSADGTTALGRLRIAGYASLQDVLLADDEELMDVLDAQAPIVRRLRRQAEALDDRIGDTSATSLEEGVHPDVPVDAVDEIGAEAEPDRPPVPLLCRLECDPLPEDRNPDEGDGLVAVESKSGTSAESETESDTESNTGSSGSVTGPTTKSAARWWMPIPPQDERPDPGSSGPFA